MCGSQTVNVQFVQLEAHGSIGIMTFQKDVSNAVCKAGTSGIKVEGEVCVIQLPGFAIRLVVDVLSIHAEACWLTALGQRPEVILGALGEVQTSRKGPSELI